MTQIAPKVAIIDSLGKHGGFHYYADGLARGLTAAGADVILYVTAFTGRTGAEPYAVKVAFGDIYGPAPSTQRGLMLLRGLSGALWDARRRGVEIVNLHVFHYGVRDVAAVWLARALGIKVVLTLHDIESFAGGKGLSPREMTLAGASGLILHNQFSLAEFNRLAPTNRQPKTIVPHGHYRDYFAEAPSQLEARTALGVAQEQTVFLFFGNSRREKGLDLLLEACARLVDAPGWQLLVAGKMKPDQLEFYRDLIRRHGLDARVRVDAKHVSDEEALLYYGSADLVVVPYRRVYESGVTIMAMSLGRAVLVSNLAPLTDNVGENAGLVFETENPAALERALRSVLHSRAELALMGERGRERTLRQRDWVEIGHKTLSFLKEIGRGNA